MPDLFGVPGEDVTRKTQKPPDAFVKHCTREEVRDLDQILDRPFVEILLVSFYF
jgi:hypothetical protein